MWSGSRPCPVQQNNRRGGGAVNILMVDDDRDCLDSMGEFLGELGHNVVACGDGQKALETFRSGDFHLVLSDIQMPGMSGIELLRAISALTVDRPVDVVLITGHGDMKTAIEALRAGAYDYLLKPVNVEELAALTERIGEHQALHREYRVLSEKFAEEVLAATAETERELNRLKKAYARAVGLDGIGIFSDKMREVFAHALKLHHDRSIPVLIEGETGTGKEVVARYVHYGDIKTTTPFVDINCAALTPSIFESELFGYEAGAFTGGLTKGQKGKLDLAQGGTLFLDEIAEIPVNLQAKLLRVIQEKEFYRVGGLKKIRTDVRIICATNVNLEKGVADGIFRQDLYYRLNVGRIVIPPLRERTEEILPLANMFLLDFARQKRKQFSKISPAAAAMLTAYPWPGNVRELRNAMEWVAFMHDDVELRPVHLGIIAKPDNPCPDPGSGHMPAGIPGNMIDPAGFTLPEGGLPLEDFEDEIVLRALAMHGGNKSETARYLGISRRSLYCRLERLKGKLPPGAG